MKTFIWFLLGVAGGFVAAHLVNKDPRGHEVLAEVDARIAEFTDRMSDAYRAQESRFTDLVTEVQSTASDLISSAADAVAPVVDAVQDGAADATDAVADTAKKITD